MEGILGGFQRPDGWTWFYLSALLMLAIYFRFSRVLSLRNWDVIALFLGVPGLLMINQVELRLRQPDGARPGQVAAGDNRPADSIGKQISALDDGLFRQLRIGYAWLFAFSGYWLVRCLIDLMLERRPRLEPNLNISGMAFLAVSLLSFLFYAILIKEPDPRGQQTVLAARRLLEGAPPVESPRNVQPGSMVLLAPVTAVGGALAGRLQDQSAGITLSDEVVMVARTTAILCHLSILAGLITIGWRHFASPATGMGMATLYLLLPLTAVNIEKIDHLLPAVFLVWAVFFFRFPIVAGVHLALAGLFYFPLFLLPLWTGFYWRRGARRFLISFAGVSAALWLLIWFLDPVRSFMEDWSSALAWRVWDFTPDNTFIGFWTANNQAYRLPILIAFIPAAFVAGVRPTEKNLADLIALSAAIILGVQFWYADRGGSYVHWYLPLVLLMIFRPNLSTMRAPEPLVKVVAA